MSSPQLQQVSSHVIWCTGSAGRRKRLARCMNPGVLLGILFLRLVAWDDYGWHSSLLWHHLAFDQHAHV